MNLTKLILKERKLQGLTWEQMAKTLPISGNALRTAFSRNSVNDIFVNELCSLLKINIAQNKHDEIENKNPQKDGFTAKELDQMLKEAKQLNAEMKEDHKRFLDIIKNQSNTINKLLDK